MHASALSWLVQNRCAILLTGVPSARAAELVETTTATTTGPPTATRPSTTISTLKGDDQAQTAKADMATADTATVGTFRPSARTEQESSFTAIYVGTFAGLALATGTIASVCFIASTFCVRLFLIHFAHTKTLASPFQQQMVSS